MTRLNSIAATLLLLTVTVTAAAQVIQATYLPIVSASSTLNTGLTAYWKMDEASGTRVDSGPNGQDLTDNNTVTSNTGIISNAAEFTAANTEYLSHTSSASLSVGDIDFTFSLWVKLSGTGTQDIFGKWGAQLEYLLQYSAGAGNFRWFISSDGTGNTSVINTSPATISSGTWYFIQCGHDSVNNVIFISVNNGTVATQAAASGVFTGGSSFGIGTRIPTASIYYGGLIDEMGFWKKRLSVSEITELYNSGAGKTCCPFAAP